MRYVITYVNITKEKCYCYVTVILNIAAEFIVTWDYSEFSPSSLWFSQFEFPRKKPLSLSVYCAEIFNYHTIRYPFACDVRLTVRSIVSENLHHRY